MSISSRTARSGNRSLRFVGLGFAVITCMGLECNDGGPLVSGSDPDSMAGDTEPPAFTPVLGLSSIHGIVTSDGAPHSGVTVTLSRGESELATIVTSGNGRYRFPELAPGVYTIAISEIAGTHCYRLKGATVAAGTTMEINFACAIPRPTGIVTGRVTVNGVGARRVVVGLREESKPMGTTSTDQDGVYLFQNVPTGIKSVEIGSYSQDPYGCPTTRQEVTVVADGTAGADFACSGEVVTGRVTVNGTPVAAVTVLVCHGDEFVDGLFCSLVATDSEGLYTFTSFPRTDFHYDPNLPSLAPAGEYMVFVDPLPAGATCQNPQSPVSVLRWTTVTVNIPCAVDPNDSGLGNLQGGEVGSVSLPQSLRVEVYGSAQLTAIVRDTTGAVITNPQVVFFATGLPAGTVDRSGLVTGLPGGCGVGYVVAWSGRVKSNTAVVTVGSPSGEGCWDY